MSSILRSAKVPAHTLALLITASSAAVAQLGDYDPALEFPGLSQATLNGMHAAAAKLYLYERQPVGTVETWTSPDGTSGEVKLVRSFDSSNMPCRTIDYTIDSQGTGHGLNPGTHEHLDVVSSARRHLEDRRGSPSALTSEGERRCACRTFARPGNPSAASALTHSTLSTSATCRSWRVLPEVVPAQQFGQLACPQLDRGRGRPFSSTATIVNRASVTLRLAPVSLCGSTQVSMLYVIELRPTRTSTA